MAMNYLRKWALAAVTSLLAACSIHPIPDDVSRYSTEDIVRNVRCEAKMAVREAILQGLHRVGLYDITPDTVLERKADFARIRQRDPDLAKKFVAYGESVIAYDFDFTINENNDNSGAVTFNMPFAGGGNVTLGLDGGLNKERKGHRTFKTVEKFKDLVKLRCDEWIQPDRNILYPLTGSIGVDRVMTTFIKVSEIGGGKGVFSDVITFTTDVRGSIKPTLVLIPVVDRFRVINANADFSGKRKDIHQVTISLAFPEIDVREARADRGIGPSSVSEPAIDAQLRALERLCIAAAEAREDRFGTLRQIPPQYFCRQSRGAPF
jgi:hypothetical protein